MAGQIRPTPLSQPTGANAPVSFDRARRLAWLDVQRTEVNQRLTAAEDPTHSNWIQKFHLDNDFRTFYGRIVDSIAYTNCYKVQVERGGACIWCTSVVATALQPMGVRQLGQLPVGVGVIFALHPTDYSGLIIGVIPDPQTASNAAMADFISQQARCGLLVDSAHSYPLTLDNSSLITDWSSGRPFDSTTAGEIGYITETGLLEFLDSFMATKRVDEECGIWHFWHDQLTRLAGHNLQLWSAGYEREDLDDEGEIDIVEGITPYYWEALGAFDHNKTDSRNIDATDWQKNPAFQAYSAVEPISDEQTAFYRLRHFKGYLGQAEKRILNVGPICDYPNSPSGINKLSANTIYPGVFEENLGLTGKWMVRSAHEMIFSKHISIPSPKLIVRPEDPAGDNSSNYKAASMLGSGPSHIVNGEIGISGGDDPAQIRASGFIDNFAFSFNWLGAHPFHYHSRDWYLPNESELEYLNSCADPAFTPPAFDRLACQHIMPTPTAIPIKVDHRYGNVNYYPNHSYFGLLAEGGIVIGCGFGAEIKLANGHIELTAPGDIAFRAGRDVISFAGYDLILRAKNSWDISATNKDGRLKVNRNLMAVAAGDCGGILLQSKATQSYCDFSQDGEDVSLGGITLKADNAQISTIAPYISFKLPETDFEERILIFDAGWKGRIKFKSKFIERFLSIDGAALDFFVTPTDAGGIVSHGSEYWSDGAIISTPLVVNDKLLVNDCGIFKQDVISTHGQVSSNLAKLSGGRLGVVTNPSSYDSLFESYITRAETTLSDIGEIELNNLYNYQDAFICSDVEFTFRSVDQYRTNDYFLFEDRWQQMARVAGIPTNTWQEQPVNGTYPYPGASILLGNTYKTLNPKLYDLSTGISADRGSVYENPQFNTPDQVILNNNYTVII